MIKKRTWVLLRGLVREQRHWGEFPDEFRRYFPHDEILLYDFPGNGARYQENSVTTITAMVDDLRLFIRSRSVTTPVHIVALSLGAMVAVEWMSRHPDECAAGILISTSLRGLNPFYQRLLPSTYPAVFSSLLIPGSIRHKETTSLKFISNIVAEDTAKREMTIANWVRYAEQCPVSGLNGLRQLLAATRFRVPNKCPNTPMLIMSSNADKLVSPLCSKKLANYWNLPIVTHDTAGHDIPLDDGKWVCKKIAHWLNDLN